MQGCNFALLACLTPDPCPACSCFALIIRLAATGEVCDLEHNSMSCTGQGRCTRDTIASAPMCFQAAGCSTGVDLYSVTEGTRPFVTEQMAMNFDIVWSSPLAGARNEYLVLFELLNVQLPPGSKLRVTGLEGTVSEPFAPLLPPKVSLKGNKRFSCGNDIR